MKKITCEICGSNELIKKEGIFECQTCGTKYSVEEVRKIVLEGSIDISGSTVKVDNSRNIDNYLNIAQNAYKVDNWVECENYCNMILEIDSKNYEAWLLKGKSAFWKSSVEKLRIEETINCFFNSLDNAPENSIIDITIEITKETQAMIMAIIICRCQQFLKPPTNYNSEEFLEYPSVEYKKWIVEAEELTIKNFEKLLSRCGFNDSELRYNVCNEIITWAMMKWLDEIEPEYSNIQGYPTWVEWQLFFSRGDAVVYLVESSTTLLKGKTIDFELYYKFLTSVYEYILSEENRIVKATERNLLSLKLSHWRLDKVIEWHRKWNEIDPTHIIPTEEELLWS